MDGWIGGAVFFLGPILIGLVIIISLYIYRAKVDIPRLEREERAARHGRQGGRLLGNIIPLAKLDVATRESIQRRLDTEPDVEVRRIMLEVMGVERFFSEVVPEVVHWDRDGLGNPRRLLRVAMRDTLRGYIQAVQVQCPSTGRQFILGVPSTVRTCQQAVAATFGMSPEQYAPEIER